MHILWIVGSTVLFSVQFLLNKFFQKREGSAAQTSVLCAAATAFFGMVLLLCQNGTALAFSLFSFVLAAVSGAKNVLMTYMSVRVMEKASLSVYSLFSMLGGMLLPFLYAILLGGESLSWQKLLCVLLLSFAMYWEMRGQKRENPDGGKQFSGALLWYMGVFVLNGLSGVFAKIHQSAPALAVSASSYTFWERLSTLLLSGILMLLFIRRGKKPHLNTPAVSLSLVAAASVLNTVANLILLAALLHVDASVQYPIVTGGVIIFSLLLEPLAGTRPRRHTVTAAVLSFAGLCLLAI